MVPFITPDTPIAPTSNLPPSLLQAMRPFVPTVLFIGDSISCGMTVADEGAAPPMLQGCLGAFPYATQHLLDSQDESKSIYTDLLAFPGWHFVSPTKEEEETGSIPAGGLETRFWKALTISMSPFIH